MRKTLAMLMAAAMVGTMAVTAFADDTTPTYDISLKDYVADAKLEPAKEYSYEIQLNGAALVAADLQGKKLTASVTKGGSAVETPKVEKNADGTYKLVVTTKDNYGTKDVNVSFRLRYTEGTKQLDSKDYTAIVGFAAMPDGDVYDELTISNSAPILTKDVLESFAKANNYRKGLMTAEGGEWSFEVNTTGMKDAVNMAYNFQGVKEILAKYEDQEFVFVNFPGRPDFGVRGKMSIDVSGEYDTENWGKEFYLYLYQDGKLYKLTSTLDTDEMTLSFNASKLGSYVVTNKAIKDSGVIQEGTGNNTQNPDTGANDVVGVAMALAVVSLISVAAISLKKK